MTAIQDYSSLFSLKDKVAVVTGGSRGLGLHAATGLLHAGCKTVYITSRKADACDEAVKELNALGLGKAIAIPADQSKFNDLERFVNEVKKTTDRVDILIANAGATWGSSFDEHKDEHFGKVMDLNVKSVFNIIRLMTPLLEKYATVEDPSRVVTTGSVAGIGIGNIGPSGTWGYAASKSAVMHLTKHLSAELAPRHILCNSIAPGFFPSKMANGLIALSGGEALLASRSPNKRLGKPEDIVGAIVYLCSRAGSHINGVILPIDGGQVIAGNRLGGDNAKKEAAKL